VNDFIAASGQEGTTTVTAHTDLVSSAAA